ncbi:MAG: hypothetical protein O3B03_01110 [Proteobacteria bacterium]|nr:hypothetical protein [Pseudomonadota bacterium]MDA1331919.1 hypothetical protein [Pseudomonadota bacterium]
MSGNNEDKTSGLHLLLAWGFVGIPLVWGLMQTIEKAMQIFV